MKFIIKKEYLIEGLNNVSKAISSKNLIPILAGIKFELKKDGLYLSASDTDISIQSFISNEKISEVIELGSIVIYGKYIVEIIRKLPNVDISIEVLDGFKMLINTDNSSFNLNGINPNEFPNLYLEETKEPIILKNSELKALISKVAFATSPSESRPILTGINFIINGDNLEVLATDSYRLAKYSINIDKFNSNSVNLVIPCRNLLELIKIIDDNGEIEMHLFNNKVLFKYKNILFQSRLLSGTYPTNSSVIPSNFEIQIDVDVNVLYEMIDRASLLTSDKDKNTIKLMLNKNELVILSNSPEIGKVEEKLSLITDKEIDISFSSKYMMEALRSFETEMVTICMNNDISPIVIKSTDENNLVQLLLPIKTY